MPSRLALSNRQHGRPVDLRLLRRVVAALLEDLGQTPQDQLGVVLVAAPEMARLHEQFLGCAGPTDVMSFDYTEWHPQTRRPGRAAAGPGGGPLRGEVVVCVDEAVSQARRYRTAWPAELVRYIIHGVLHLRGFDDHTPGARRRMKSAETRHLRALARRFPLSKLARAG